MNDPAIFVSAAAVAISAITLIANQMKLRRAQELDQSMNSNLIVLREQIRDLNTDNEKLRQRCSLLEHDLKGLKSERMSLIEQNMRLLTINNDLESEIKRRDSSS